MIPSKSPFQFAFQNSFVHKKIIISENNEDIEDYAAQDHEVLNTMEATTVLSVVSNCCGGTLRLLDFGNLITVLHESLKIE